MTKVVASQRGNVFYLLGATAAFSTRHIEIHGDSCYYRPKHPVPFVVPNPTIGAIISLDGGEAELRRIEITCGTWEYPPNITLAQNIFPSDLAEMEVTEVGIRVNADLLGMESWATMKRLRKQGEWLIRRDEVQGYRFRADPTKDSAPELEIEEGTTAEEATPEIASFLEAANALAGIMKGFEGFGVKKHADMAGLIREKTVELHGVWRWFDSLPPESQSALLKRFGPGLAKLAVQVFDAPLLEQYLTGLEWTRDIIPIDPRWMKDWPHKNQEKAVVHFKNLSLIDVEIRLFWARRGQYVFAFFRDAVGRELKARQTQR